MTKDKLHQLIKGTKIRNTPSLRAAEIYFVEGITNVTRCAEIAGCLRQSAQRTINRIKELIDQQALEAVTVLVPKGKGKAIEDYAMQLRREAQDD